MSAVAVRLGLAAIGRDLIAREGGPGEWRAAMLRRRLAGPLPAPLTLADLPAVPAWARLPRAALRRLALHVGLVSIAPALAASIDGEWLRGHAEAAGDEALDWALEKSDRAPAGLPPVDGPDLAARGHALMRAALPPALRDMIEGVDDRRLSAEDAAACLALALEAGR